MIFAYIADLHFSRYGQDKIEENLPERLYSLTNSLEEVASYCLQNEIKDLIIGGDLLHGKSIIYAIAQELLLNFVKKYTKNGLTLWVIDGNHDLSSKGENVVSALRPLEDIPGVNWIRFDTIFRKAPEDILFVPYSYNVSDIVKQNKARILVSHFGLNEGVLNSGTSIISDLGLKDLRDRYELVLLGHYHKPQEIIEQNLKLYYSGSVIQLDWGEKNDEKRFLIVDTDTLDVQSIPITSYKKHLELELTEGCDIETVIAEAKKHQDEGNHVKLIMKDKIDLSTIKEKDLVIVDKTETDMTNRGITTSMSLSEKLHEYMNIREVPDSKKDQFFNSITKLLEEKIENI